MICGSTLAEQVAEYNLKIKPKADEEYQHYQNQASSEKAIKCATYALKANGKCHSHQRWIKSYVMEAVRIRLMEREPELLACHNFEDLHSIVWECAVGGFATLSVYDTAHRLGAYLGIKPTFVYLHRGTMVGAVMLGLDVSRGVVHISELPEEMQAMQAEDAENFLCIYKRELNTEEGTSESKCAPKKAKRNC